jgi:hypothetical protein
MLQLLVGRMHVRFAKTLHNACCRGAAQGWPLLCMCVLLCRCMGSMMSAYASMGQSTCGATAQTCLTTSGAALVEAEKAPGVAAHQHQPEQGGSRPGLCSSSSAGQQSAGSCGGSSSTTNSSPAGQVSAAAAQCSSRRQQRRQQPAAMPGLAGVFRVVRCTRSRRGLCSICS